MATAFDERLTSVASALTWSGIRTSKPNSPSQSSDEKWLLLRVSLPQVRSCRRDKNAETCNHRRPFLFPHLFPPSCQCVFCGACLCLFTIKMLAFNVFPLRLTTPTVRLSLRNLQNNISRNQFLLFLLSFPLFSHMFHSSECITLVWCPSVFEKKGRFLLPMCAYSSRDRRKWGC